MEKDFASKCFVCGKKLEEIKNVNPLTNLPVCDECKDTELEKMKEKEALDSLAEGFVCGCI